MRFDVAAVRQDFPILHQDAYPSKPLVFLDSAASTQKPRQVIDAMARIMEQDYANVHRGVHVLSQRATDIFESARAKVAAFMNAQDREIVFTKNTTEAINLVAQAWGRTALGAGDQVLITELEHHANIVPWQLVCAATGAELRVVRINDDGTVDLDDFRAKISSGKVKLFACAHISNVLGTVLPLDILIPEARAAGALTLIDGSQGLTHRKVDMAALGADFYVWTAHKLYGPTGLGVLYGRYEALDAMPPWQGGGDMIASVSFAGSTFKAAPFKFEAGTPAIVEAAGVSAAIDWVEALGIEAIAAHEAELVAAAHRTLNQIEGVKIYGTAPNKAAVVSFLCDKAHAHDVGTLLDRAGIAIRVGHHCAEPLMQRFGLAATARASFAAYNTLEEVEKLGEAVRAVQEFFA